MNTATGTALLAGPIASSTTPARSPTSALSPSTRAGPTASASRGQLQAARRPDHAGFAAFWYGGTSAATATTVNLTANTTLNIVVNVNWTLSGTVKTSTGTALPGSIAFYDATHARLHRLGHRQRERGLQRQPPAGQLQAARRPDHAWLRRLLVRRHELGDRDHRQPHRQHDPEHRRERQLDPLGHRQDVHRDGAAGLDRLLQRHHPRLYRPRSPSTRAGPTASASRRAAYKLRVAPTRPAIPPSGTAARASATATTVNLTANTTLNHHRPVALFRARYTGLAPALPGPVPFILMARQETSMHIALPLRRRRPSARPSALFCVVLLATLLAACGNSSTSAPLGHDDAEPDRRGDGIGGRILGITWGVAGSQRSRGVSGRERERWRRSRCLHARHPGRSWPISSAAP